MGASRMARFSLLALLVACGSTATVSDEDLGRGMATVGPNSSVVSQPRDDSPEPGATAGRSGAVPEVDTGRQADVDADTGAEWMPTIRGGNKANPGVGPGITDKTIKVGLIYASDSAAANKAAGGQGDVDNGDVKAYWDAALDATNQAGGIAGRKVVGVFFNASVLSAQTVEQQVQAACSTWHDDNKVFAVLDAGGNDVIQRCTHRAGAVMISGSNGMSAARTFRQFPGYIEVNGLEKVDEARVTAEGLTRQRYFEGKPKVGVVTWDYPAFREAVEKGTKPVLRRLGLADPSVQYVSPPQTFNDVGATSAAIKTAVLRFQSEGVTHVLIQEGRSAGLAGGGFMLVFFSQNAESQAYRPRYGLNSLSFPSNIAPTVPDGQLNGAVAVGWLPSMDVLERDDPRSRWTPQKRKCVESMEARDRVVADRRQQHTVSGICDALNFLRDSLAVGGEPTKAGFLRGVSRLGGRFGSAMTMRTWFSASVHAGVAAARPLAYDVECDCFHYSGPMYSLR